jgi:membrane protein DedA with SNARE-associated domain
MLAVHGHGFHGPAIDYVGLAAAAGASWAGVPGPGEPVLIATAVIASRHNLDISSVLIVAWFGANAGGIVGWLVGMRTGRALMTARGPLLKLRLATVERGDKVFDRYAVVAILLTPSWIAGIHRVRPAVYLPTNAVGAVAWAVGIGMAAYMIGPAVIDFVDDFGFATGIVVAVVVVALVAVEVRRRRRRAARRPELG